MCLFCLDICRLNQGRRRHCCPSCFSLTALLSLFCSIIFFLVNGYVMYNSNRQNIALFCTSVLFVVEILIFVKYCIDIFMLKRNKLSWHIKRATLPLIDLVVVLIASWMTTTLLPCGVISNIYSQIELLAEDQIILIFSTAIAIVFKLVTTVILTFLHINTQLRMMKGDPSFESTFDPEMYPYNQTVRTPRSARAPRTGHTPSAPPLTDTYSID